MTLFMHRRLTSCKKQKHELVVNLQSNKQWPTYALISLLSETPQKLLAERTERGLPEELGHKLVAVCVVRALVLNRTASLGDVAGT